MSWGLRPKSILAAPASAAARFVASPVIRPGHHAIEVGHVASEPRPFNLPDSTVLDEAALLAIAEDIGSQDLLVILMKLRENLSQHAEKFMQAIAQGDLALAKRTAHDIKGMGMQFGAPHLAKVAKVAELDAKKVEDMPASSLVAAIGTVNVALDAFNAKFLKNRID